MNPWIQIGILLATFASGWQVNSWMEDAGRLRDQQIIDQAQIGTARAIAKIEVKNVTIHQNLEREIHEKTVYADCRHSPDGLRLINATLAGPDNHQLPDADAPAR